MSGWLLPRKSGPFIAQDLFLYIKQPAATCFLLLVISSCGKLERFVTIWRLNIDWLG